jgi:hypothetical protein
MAASVTQFLSNGVVLTFATNFKITKGGLLNVFITVSGNQANEITDLVASSNYTLNYATSDDFTLVSVVFNVAPVINSVVTLVPLADAAISIDFTQTTQLIPADFNLALAEHTSPIDYSFSLFENLTPRYNKNENLTDINYSLLLPALKSKEFWRRNNIATGQPEAGMLAQDFDEFVKEVSIASSQASGLLEEISVSASASQTTFSLVSNSTAWLGVTFDALVVHVNGLRISQTGSYTVNVLTSPTLATPSTLIFTSPLNLGDKLLIDRPKPVPSTTLMNIDSSNASFNVNSLVADRALTNVQFGATSLAADRALTNVQFGATSLVSQKTLSNVTGASMATKVNSGTGIDLSTSTNDITLSLGAGQTIQTVVSDIPAIQIANNAAGGNAPPFLLSAASPLITQGRQILTVPITPSSSTNDLHFTGNIRYAVNGLANVVLTIFRQSDGALLYIATSNSEIGGLSALTVDFIHNVSSTTTETYLVRAGVVNAVTMNINGTLSLPTTLWDGKLKSSLTINEIKQL